MRCPMLVLLLLAACEGGKAQVRDGKPDDTPAGDTDARAEGSDDDTASFDDTAPAEDTGGCPGGEAAATWHADADGDGYGDAASSVEACVAPPATVADATDCDDTDADVHPGATESLDGVDADCDEAAEGYGLDVVASLHVRGDATFDGLGGAVSGGGDQDGDGLDDLALGAAGVDPSGDGGDCNGWGGMVYVVRGPTAGVLEAQDADARIAGGSDELAFGTSVAWVGDVDRDDRDDLLVGGSAGGVEAPGGAWLFHGPLAGDLTLDDAVVEIRGDATGDRVGWRTRAAGDVDADGVPDLLVGGYEVGDGGAAAWFRGDVMGHVAFSEGDGLLVGDADGAAGFSLAGPGDVDGDGYDDLVVGAPLAGGVLGGTVYVVRGPARGVSTLADAALVIHGDTARGELGYAASGAGDVDDDGRPDLAIGSLDGVTWLVAGTLAGSWAVSDTALARLAGTRSEASAVELAHGGDLGEDGVEDVLIGVPAALSPDRLTGGAVHLASGSARGERATAAVGWTLWGAMDQGMVGSDVSGAGDFDGDGRNDLVVGAVGERAYRGGAYLVPGSALVPE